MKICRLCQENKEEAEFSSFIRSTKKIKDKKYLISYCKICQAFLSLLWRRNNPDKAKAYYQSNKERMDNNSLRWLSNNRKDHLHFGKLSKFRKMNRVPYWVNANELREIYVNCPDRMEVDHIVPIRGENVSGLHVPWNLQYLTKEDNRSKNNRLIEDN